MKHNLSNAPINSSRRDLLRLLGLAGASSLLAGLPCSAQANLADGWQGQFDAALKTEAWALGYRTPTGDLSASKIPVRGRFPAAVQGVLFRNGPALHDLGGERNHHQFDGDGMIQRFILSGDTLSHTGKYIRTSKYLAETQAQRRLYKAFGTDWPNAQKPLSPDSINVANTSVLPVAGELLALWEGGSATRLDLNTLETKGIKTWRDDLAGLPFSAHPKVDPDGTIWNFGVGSGQGLLVLYQIGTDGQLRRAEAIPVPDVPMIHDFAVTDKHLVFLMPPLVMDRQRFETMSFLDAHVWRPELGMRVLVIDKNDWSLRYNLTLPTGFLFHLSNAWEDEAGVIRLDYVRSDDPTILFQTTRDVMRGQYLRAHEPKLTSVTLDPKRGMATQEILPIDAEFPRINARLTGLRHRYVIHATQPIPQRPGYTAIARTDVETGHSDRYIYGTDHFAEEHIYIPDGSSPGWILGTALDLKQRNTVISCFAADRLAAGPVAQATLPYALPLGLHGQFI